MGLCLIYSVSGWLDIAVSIIHQDHQISTKRVESVLAESGSAELPRLLENGDGPHSATNMPLPPHA